MALFRVSASDASSGGNGCVQPQGRRKAFRMSCTNAFSVRVRLRSRTKLQIQASALSSCAYERDRSSQGGPVGRCGGDSSGGGILACGCSTPLMPQLLSCIGQAAKTTAPFMRGANSRVRQATWIGAHQPRRSRSQQGTSLWVRECLAQTALRSGSGCFNVVAAVRAAQQGCQPQSSKGRA